MTGTEMNDAYFTCADALGMKPRESLIEAAERYLRSGTRSPLWRVAAVILNADNATTEGSWAGIFKASRTAKAIARLGIC